MKALALHAGSYSAAAKLIAADTKRPLSIDAIKSWTCDPGTLRSRTCPDWAIEALERRLGMQPEQPATTVDPGDASGNR